MTDEKSKSSAKSPDAPKATDDKVSKSNFARAAKDSGKKDGGKAAATGKGGRGWLWLLLIVVLLGGVGTWAWYQWPQLREQLGFLPKTKPAPESAVQTPQESVSKPGAAVQPEATPRGSDYQAQQQLNATLTQQIDQQRRTITQLQLQLAELQRDVTAQGNRLAELGNVSREDWQLAEADYLLRLANQRLLLERDNRAALALVEEVDNIVKQVDLPDLYGVRQQLARDITALKLVENIDREGLYLRLRALEEQLLRVSIQPQFDLATRKPAQAEAESETPAAGPMARSWHNFTRYLRDSVRIRDGEIDPVLLSPQSEARFRQNLRLSMEQAELALLREDTTVYKDALDRARQLLLKYGTDNNQREVLLRELQELSAEDIESNLPSLAASQNALHNYIERLHKATPAEGSAPQAPEVQLPGESDTEQAPEGDSQ